MSPTLGGVSGSLLPLHYLEERLPEDAAPLMGRGPRGWNPRKLDTWWRRVEGTCGPASGLRSLFDVVAMPLFAMLGFRASQATFARDRCTVVLETSAGTPVALLLLPWASRPAGLWRDVARAAREIDASWSFVLAPPFLSLVDARGCATRRTLDFCLPDVATDGAFDALGVLAHADAFDRPAHRHGPPRLERLIEMGARYQARVRNDLQHGVTDAVEVLTAAIRGATQRQEGARRSRSRSGHGATASIARTSASAETEALTLVYRILFLLFAESRRLVPGEDPTYRSAYAMSRLCREALRREPRFGLWDALAATTRLSRSGCQSRALTIHPFNGHLFARHSAPSLEWRPRARRRLRPHPQEEAVRHALVALGSRATRAGRELISYRDLGVEQLGAVYERLLDQPDLAPSTPRRRQPRAHAHSARRKETGTFYTPRALAEFVVRRTLAPLVSGASTSAILALRIVDPAMGSGAFLVAACRYLAAAYAQALVDEGQASPEDLDEREQAAIRRRLAERCLVGVDRNPVAVQLARLSLWLTTLAGGKPLSFLDHRLRCGDSLIGAFPEDLSVGVPGRRSGFSDPDQLPLFDASELEDSMRQFARPFGELLTRHDDTVADVKRKEALWIGLAGERSALHPWRMAASLWCARFFWPDTSGKPPASSEFRALVDSIVRKDRTLSPGRVSERLAVARAVASHRGFLHWPLEFPDVFYDVDGSARERPGFDAVIGNPPWEMWRREGAGKSGTMSGPDHTQFVQFVRHSGGYPSCNRGHLNLYQPFLERSLSLARRGGRIGLILPWGLATDEGAAPLRARLMDETTLETIVGLDNAAALFPIHRGTRFLVLVAAAGGRTRETRARFGVTTSTEVDGLPAQDEPGGAEAYPVRLTSSCLSRLSGVARRIPDVRRPTTLALAERLCTEFPALGDPSSFGCRFGRELNATEARQHFGAEGLLVIEGKDVRPFQVRPAGRTFITRERARGLLPDARFERPRLAYRDVSAVGNRLSLIAAIAPAGVVTTHTVYCLRSLLDDDRQQFLCGLFNSYVLNALVRLLMGGHLTTSLVEGLPAPAWHGDADDVAIASLARQVADAGPQSESHADLQARVARRYGLSEPDLEDMLAGFPLVPATERTRVVEAFTRLRP